MRRWLALFAGAFAAAASAAPVRYALPAATVPPALAGKDSEAVVNACSACHSLDYITTQPRGKGAKFWSDEVAKMVSVYGAPLDAAEAARVTQVLARKFG